MIQSIHVSIIPLNDNIVVTAREGSMGRIEKVAWTYIHYCVLEQIVSRKLLYSAGSLASALWRPRGVGWGWGRGRAVILIFVWQKHNIVKQLSSNRNTKVCNFLNYKKERDYYPVFQRQGDLDLKVEKDRIRWMEMLWEHRIHRTWGLIEFRWWNLSLWEGIVDGEQGQSPLGSTTWFLQICKMLKKIKSLDKKTQIILKTKDIKLNIFLH